MAAGAPSEVTEAAFSRWKVELTNKLAVHQEKQAHQERLQFKQHEDNKFWERKQALHKKTADQFGKAKMEVEAVRQANLTRGAEYKAELEEMKEMAAQQREEWMQFGHELTVQHGPEQMERTKARLAETAEQKAEQGRQVKQVAQLNNKQRHVQRTNRLDEKRALVETTKHKEFSNPEESKNFSFHQKEEMGGEVRRTERRWKSLSKQEREAFLTHAHENHEKNDFTKEHMRDARKDIIKKNCDVAAQERERKVRALPGLRGALNCNTRVIVGGGAIVRSGPRRCGAICIQLAHVLPHLSVLRFPPLLLRASPLMCTCTALCARAVLLADRGCHEDHGEARREGACQPRVA